MRGYLVCLAFVLTLAACAKGETTDPTFGGPSDASAERAGGGGAGGNPATGGAGGSSGSALGGTGGLAGTGGTGGSSATGGTGGSSATGGTGGSSATGGTGGSSATGGTGGSSGTGGSGALDPALSLPDPGGDPCTTPGGYAECPLGVCRIATPTGGRCESCSPCGHLNDPCQASSECDTVFQCYMGHCTNFCILGTYMCGPIDDCIDIGHVSHGVCAPY